MESLYPPLAFSFKLSFGQNASDVDASFQEVTGIGPEMETEVLREGGENRFVHVLPQSIKYPKLSLKRGIAALDSPLVKWCKEVLEGDWVKPIVPQLVHVFLLDENRETVRSWSFESAYPVHWAIEPFQSMKNEVAVERIELCYACSKREK
jgi:phage tail-like protein